MRVSQISQQGFRGTLHVIGEIGTEQAKALELVKPAINDMIAKQNFDLFIKRSSFGEVLVGTDLSSGYIVNSDNNFLRSTSMAIKDKLQGSYLQRKINAVKKALSELTMNKDIL